MMLTVRIKFRSNSMKKSRKKSTEIVGLLLLLSVEITNIFNLYIIQSNYIGYIILIKLLITAELQTMYYS